MSTLKTQLHQIGKMVAAGHYEFFHLTDERNKIVIPGKRPSKLDPNRAITWFDFLQARLLNELPPGKYTLRAYMDRANKNFNDYALEKKKSDVFEEAEVLPNNPAKVYSAPPMGSIPVMDIKEYTSLVKRIAELEADRDILNANIRILTEENTRLKSELNDLEEGMDEAAPDDIFSKLGQGFEAIKPLLPELSQGLKKFMNLKEREIILKERQAGFTPKGPLKKLTRNKPNPTPPPPKQGPPTIEEITQYFDALLDSDPDRANQELDELEAQHPEIYNQVADNLGLEDEQENENVEQ